MTSVRRTAPISSMLENKITTLKGVNAQIRSLHRARPFSRGRFDRSTYLHERERERELHLAQRKLDTGLMTRTVNDKASADRVIVARLAWVHTARVFSQAETSISRRGSTNRRRLPPVRLVHDFKRRPRKDKDVTSSRRSRKSVDGHSNCSNRYSNWTDV